MAQDNVKPEADSDSKEWQQGELKHGRIKQYPYRKRFELIFTENKNASDGKPCRLKLIHRDFPDEDAYRKAFSPIALDLIPLLDQIQFHVASMITDSLKRIIQKDIEERKLTYDEKVALYNRRIKQGNNMLEFYTDVAITRYIKTLPVALADALENHLEESIERAMHDWSGQLFGDENVSSIGIKAENWSTTLDNIANRQREKLRKRLGAPGHGGERGKRGSGVLQSIDDQVRFAMNVRELEKTRWNNKSLWKYLIDKMESEDYSDESLKSLEQDKQFASIHRKLLKEVITKRKPYHSESQNIPAKYSPLAFTLKHAYIITTGIDAGIDDHPSFERLRKLLPEAKARLESIENRSTKNVSYHFKVFDTEDGKMRASGFSTSTEGPPMATIEFPDDKVITKLQPRQEEKK